MNIKKGFVIEKVADSYLACATGALAKDFSGFVKLNSTGAFLWNLLAEGDRSEDDLINALIDAYEVDASVAANDVKAFLKILIDNGIIE